MSRDAPATIELLERLIGFPTVSRSANLDLIDWVRAFLAGHGVAAELVHDETGSKANLFATFGPGGEGGVILSGHTDVVPVEGQAWTSDPFRLTRRGDRLLGRGAADMKGFLAAVLAMVGRWRDRPPRRPVHLAFSYDEEVGCIGVRRLLELLAGRSLRPACCIIGEPTSMRVVTAHKGKIGQRVTCTGRASHSSLAPHSLNAVHMALDLVTAIRELQAGTRRDGPHDPAYDVPYTTLHVGALHGGDALNIVPDRCRLDFEIRHLPEQPFAPLLDAVMARARAIEAGLRPDFPEAAIAFEPLSAYPALATDGAAEVVGFARSLGGEGEAKVAFGTEGGLFVERLGVPTVVCGPGSIEQAHKPDEFITTDQLGRCDRFLDALMERLGG